MLSTTSPTTSRLEGNTKTLELAPMLDVTTREFRFFMRLLSRRMTMWTEMVVDQTVNHASNLDFHLGYSDEEQPLVIQLGGNNPEQCASAALKMCGAPYCYRALNLNVGCPSDRVSGKGEFGAVLMKKPAVVRDVMTRIAEALEEEKEIVSEVELSVKTRIGVDGSTDRAFLEDFIETVQSTGRVKKFILHARSCVLKGLTPAQNRSIPPLNYERVFEMCDRFPDLEFWLNGGVKNLVQAKQIAYGRTVVRTPGVEGGGKNGDDDSGTSSAVVPAPAETIASAAGGAGSGISGTTAARDVAPQNLRGVMMGRAAMENPCLFADADRYFYGEEANPCGNRRELLERYCAYLEGLYPRQCTGTGSPCPICACLYDVTPASARNGRSAEIELRASAALNPASGGSEETSTAAAPGCSSSTRVVVVPAMKKVSRKNRQNDPSAKISTGTVGRCTKPVLGVFYNLPGNRQFRRDLDELTRDLRVRNCGPAYIIRRAMSKVEAELLDRPFVKADAEVEVVLEEVAQGTERQDEHHLQHQEEPRPRTGGGTQGAPTTSDEIVVSPKIAGAVGIAEVPAGGEERKAEAEAGAAVVKKRRISAASSNSDEGFVMNGEITTRQYVVAEREHDDERDEPPLPGCC